MNIQLPTREEFTKKYIERIDCLYEKITKKTEEEEVGAVWEYFYHCYNNIYIPNKFLNSKQLPPCSDLWYYCSKIYSFFGFPEKLCVTLSYKFFHNLKKEKENLFVKDINTNYGILNLSFEEFIEKAFSFLKTEITNEKTNPLMYVFPAPIFREWHTDNLLAILSESNFIKKYYSYKECIFNHEELSKKEYFSLFPELKFKNMVFDKTNNFDVIDGLHDLETIAFNVMRMLHCNSLQAPKLIQDNLYIEIIRSLYLLLPHNLSSGINYEDFEEMANALTYRFEKMLAKYKIFDYERIKNDGAIFLMIIRNLAEILDDPFAYNETLDDEEYDE